MTVEISLLRRDRRVEHEPPDLRHRGCDLLDREAVHAKVVLDLEDLQAEIGRLLPRVEILWWKPKEDLESGHLEALAKLPKFRIFGPQHFHNQLPYEGRWDALLRVPSLERVETGRGDDQNGAAPDRLVAARPGLVVDPQLTRSRKPDGP